MGRGELVEAGGLARGGGGGWLAYPVITCNELCSWSLRAGEEEVLPLRLLLTDCRNLETNIFPKKFDQYCLLY